MQVVAIWKTKLGEDHPDTLTSMANLALTYQHHSQWSEADALQLQMMASSKTKLGKDHPGTLRSMAYLTIAHQNLEEEGLVQGLDDD